MKSSWLKSDLHIGDEITITFGDIDELKVSKPISVRDFHDVEAERQLMLDAYRELKQELLKEGSVTLNVVTILLLCSSIMAEITVIY